MRLEIDTQEDTLITVKQRALELIAGTGGGHINQEAIQEHMEVVNRKWQRLKHLTVQRCVLAEPVDIDHLLCVIVLCHVSILDMSNCV